MKDFTHWEGINYELVERMFQVEEMTNTMSWGKFYIQEQKEDQTSEWEAWNWVIFWSINFYLIAVVKCEEWMPLSLTNIKKGTKYVNDFFVFALSDDQQFLSFRNWSKSCQIPQKHFSALPQVVIVGGEQGGWSNQQIGRLLSWEKYRTYVVVWGTMARALQTQTEPKR